MARKLGEYLISSGACDEKALGGAFARQETLRLAGEEVRLGALLLEERAVSEKALAGALRQQYIDLLHGSPAFSPLSRETVAELLDRAGISSFPAGAVICSQGEMTDTAFVVLSGVVGLTHASSAGEVADMGTFQAGELFGEMSLLAGGPRFVSARALSSAEILVIPTSLFLNIYTRHPQLGQAAVRRWFAAIAESRLQSRGLQSVYYKELISGREDLPCLPLYGSSRHARRLRQTVESLVRTERPALFTGPGGSMKSRVSQYIAENGPRADEPFIVFDPMKFPEFLSAWQAAGSGAVFRDELLQAGALFGIGGGLDEYAMPWQGFLQLAGNGTLVVLNIELLTPKVQRVLASYLRTGVFRPVGSERPARAACRMLATAADELDLTRELLDAFEGAAVRIAPLAERKRDMREIVAPLLPALTGGKSNAVIEPEAIQRMTAYEWPGGFRELVDVLRRGTHLARGAVLTAEDIYIGSTPITGKKAFNLLNIPLVRHFFQNPFFPIAPRVGLAILFLAVVGLGLWGNPSPDSNISLLLIWANWEPLLILSCFVAARFWCSFCPIGFIGDLFRRIPRRRIPIPPRYLEKGFFVSALGLAIIFWSQSALDMWTRPAETAGLLIAMLGSAVAFALLFEGRVWCRAFCPLGQMVATFARTSVVEVRANYTYCANQCQTYECHSGRDGQEGCSMNQGPFALETNRDCILCGNCIKSCPNQSVRVNLRAPGWELWNTERADLAALLFVPLLWGTQVFRGLEATAIQEALSAYLGSRSWSLALLMAAAVVLAFHVALAGMAFLGRGGRRAVGAGGGSVFVFAMLPLTYANEIVHRLVPLTNHAAEFFVILGNQLGRRIPHVAFRLDMQSIAILQVVILLLGLAASLYVLERLVRRLGGESGVSAFFRYLPIFVMAAVSLLLL